LVVDRNVKSAASSTRAAEGDIQALFLGARLMTLVNLMRRITASRFQRSFDLSLVEGWVMSRLGLSEPISLDKLAWQNGLAKSQMSKSVKRLVERGLISRGEGRNEAGELSLHLTADGRKMFDEIVRRAPRYNDLLASGLEPTQRADLLEMIDLLTENSRQNLETELNRDDESP
jgi:DNA-binding MarR family transcriptional regulator